MEAVGAHTTENKNSASPVPLFCSVAPHTSLSTLLSAHFWNHSKALFTEGRVTAVLFFSLIHTCCIRAHSEANMLNFKPKLSAWLPATRSEEVFLFF